jgi:antitoxin ParD1/3/4
MNVSLTPQLEALVQGKVASGLYNSASEVVREALRLLEESDRVRASRLAELRGDVAVGIDQLERGQSTRHDDASLHALADDIKAKGRKRLAKKNRPT